MAAKNTSYKVHVQDTTEAEVAKIWDIQYFIQRTQNGSLS